MEVEIKDLDNFGRGITYIDNKICFIENTLPNEIVKIKIINEKKKYLEGKVLDYIRISRQRIDSICPYYKSCGGCNLNHLAFSTENNFKISKVKNLLKKFANIEEEVVENIHYHEDKFYRNKIVLHGKDGKLGLYKKSTKEIVEIENCSLVSLKINQIIKEIIKVNKNITEAIIKISNDESQSMVKITGEVKDLSSLSKVVTILIVNNKLLSNNSTIVTNIGNKIYKESISSFFQINRTLTKDLYDKVLITVKDLKPNKVLDLYCGTGTIGIYVSDYCKDIIGIDYNQSNINDANENKKLNKLPNINFICDKVENQIDSFKDIDLIIVDPPRAGLDKKTLKTLTNINASDVIYISCDPVTLARDLNYLKEKYKIISVTPYNMFPRTFHVECVCIMSKKQNC